MKKSQQVSLILITAALASCQKPVPDHQRKVYMRSDTTAPYSSHRHHGPGLWYYAFRPYGYYHDGHYTRAGYYSGALSRNANIGSNGFKNNVVRGGFGRSGYSVSS